MVHGQEAVEGAEEHVGHVKGEVLEEEEAGRRGDVEPAPVLLAERLVGLEHDGNKLCWFRRAERTSLI